MSTRNALKKEEKRKRYNQEQGLYLSSSCLRIVFLLLTDPSLDGKTTHVMFAFSLVGNDAIIIGAVHV